MCEQRNFESVIDGWVSAELGRPRDWASLLYSLPSVYPAAALESAKRCSLSHMIRFQDPKATDYKSSWFAMQLWSEGKLETPHPQDASWWFANSALDTMGDRLERLTSVGDHVLFLGAPTLFHFTRERLVGRHLTLLDKERCGATSTGGGPHQRVVVDLLREQPHLAKAAVVVADPPWYGSEMRAFLLTARRNAKRGTKILLSVPPVGTRPGVQREWNELITWAKSIGLELVNYEMARLPYVSPLFEWNALGAAGIQSFPIDWRRGDFATLSCVEADDRVGSFAFAAVDSEWKEVRIGRVRVRIRAGPCDGWDDPGLREGVRGGVLPSVSRRDKRLECIAVWTSGNRVFRCVGASVLYRIAEALSMGQSAALSVESYLGLRLAEEQIAHVGRAAEALREIMVAEEREIEDWENRLNENMAELPACKG